MAEEKEVASAPGGLAKLFKFANRPFVVTVVGGLIVWGISSLGQERYSRSQLEFLNEQARANHLWEGALSAQDEIAKAVGKRLAASAFVAQAHKKRFEYDQYLEVVKTHERMLREWDEAEESMKLRLSVYFSDPEVVRSWKEVHDGIQKIQDATINLTDNYKSTDRSAKHDAQIQECLEAIGAVEGSMETLTAEMMRHTELLLPKKQ